MTDLFTPPSLAPTDPAYLPVSEPVRGILLGRMPVMDRAEVAARVAALRAHQPDWEGAGVRERVRVMGRFRDWLCDHRGELIDLLRAETGKPRPEAVLEVGMGLDLLGYYAARAPRSLAPERPWPHGLLTAGTRLSVHRRPYPVVGLIVPWNFPVGLTLFDLVPALLAGAAVVVKPSECAPLAAARLLEGWTEIDAPPVLAAVTGLAGVGESLVDTVDFVQFTGSTETGRRVAQRAASRLVPCSLELGGKDAALVLADADLDHAARGIAFGALANTGQMCTSVERVYVVEEVYEDFVERLVHVVSGLRQDPHGATDVGVLTTTRQARHVRRQIADALAAGAVRRTGAHDAGGPQVPPTVLTGVDHSMEVMVEETFGPVIPVMRVRDADEAVRLANDSAYGLSASVWSRDLRRAAEVAARLEVGSVDLNESSTHLACFPVPQSGWKTSGLGGRLGGPAGIHKFCRTQAITRPRFPVSLGPLVWPPYDPVRTALVERLLRATHARGLRRFGVAGREERA